MKNNGFRAAGPVAAIPLRRIPRQKINPKPQNAKGATHPRLMLLKALRYAARAEVTYPSSVVLRKRLMAIKKASQLLLEELADFRMRALLCGSDAHLQSESELLDALSDSRPTRLLYAREIHRNLAGGNYIPNRLGPSAREFCALIVGVQRQLESGKWPGKTTVMCTGSAMIFGSAPPGYGRIGDTHQADGVTI